MKRILIFVTLTFFATQAFAWEEEIECVAGKCEGWRGEYNGDVSRGYAVPFVFYNESGTDAFNIKVHVNFYDYFGEYLGRFESKTEGPIHERLPFAVTPPRGATNASFEIYWKDTYEN